MSGTCHRCSGTPEASTRQGGLSQSNISRFKIVEITCITCLSPICEAVGSWDTSKVTTMASMFHGASSFNQSLNDWHTSSVLDMSSMFVKAVVFNQADAGLVKLPHG